MGAVSVLRMTPVPLVLEGRDAGVGAVTAVAGCPGPGAVSSPRPVPHGRGQGGVGVFSSEVESAGGVAATAVFRVHGMSPPSA